MKQQVLENSPEILKKFLGYMQTIKGRSATTIEQYYADLRTFFKFLLSRRGNTNSFEEIDISEINLDILKTVDLLEIYEYMNYLMSERNNSATSRARKVSSMRSFFKYLTKKTNQLEINPAEELETPKKGKTLPKFLNLEQSKLLLKTIKSNGGNHSIRDHCIVTLFLNCGMRLSELCGINFGDLGDSGTLKLRGKGNKERLVYLNKACEKAIEDYKKVRPNDKVRDKNALFISRNLRRISPKTIQFLMKKYFKMAGLSGLGLSTHKLRHTAATLMYQHGGVDIRVLKDILGHTNLGTTEIYTHLSDKQIKTALEANPLAGE